MLMYLLAGLLIFIGAQALTEKGLPLSRGSQSKRITGVAAKLIGVACLLLGLAIVGLMIRGAMLQ